MCLYSQCGVYHTGLNEKPVDDQNHSFRNLLFIPLCVCVCVFVCVCVCVCVCEREVVKSNSFVQI